MKNRYLNIQLAILIFYSPLLMSQVEHRVNLSDSAFYNTNICSKNDDCFIRQYLDFEFADSLPDGKWYLFGKEGRDENKFGDESKLLGIGFYANGLKHGEFKYYKYEENGERLSYILNYFEGKLHGSVTYKNKTEMICEGFYYFGKRNGPFNVYSEGKLKSSKFFVVGEMQNWIEIYNDKISKIGNGPISKREGYYLSYGHENGSLSIKALFQDGKLKEYEIYYKNGNVRVKSKGVHKGIIYIASLGQWRTPNFGYASELIQGKFTQFDEEGNIFDEKIIHDQ